MDEKKVAELRRDYIRYTLFGRTALAAKQIKDVIELAPSSGLQLVGAIKFMIEPASGCELVQAVKDQIEAERALIPDPPPNCDWCRSDGIGETPATARVRGRLYSDAEYGQEGMFEAALCEMHQDDDDIQHSEIVRDLEARNV